MDGWTAIEIHPYLMNAIETALLLAVLLVLRVLVLRTIRGSSVSAGVKRRWQVQAQLTAAFLFLAGSGVIWADEVRAAILSLAAIAVAFTIATKELITCLLGNFIRASGCSFAVGDRIEVGDIRGDVMDIGAFSTTVLETGPGPTIYQRTGRTVTIPHSELVGKPVFNETAGHDYVLHVLEISLTTEDDWQRAERVLLAAARKECAPFIAGAASYLDELGGSYRTGSQGLGPTVYLRMTEPGQIRLLLRFPAPTRHRDSVEQKILRQFLSSFQGEPRSHAALVERQPDPHPLSLPTDPEPSFNRSFD